MPDFPCICKINARDELLLRSWPLAEAWLRLACRGLTSQRGMPFCTACL